MTKKTQHKPRYDGKRLGRRLKLRDLNILMTVAQCGTMGKAAAQLAVSQPVVSKAIADLEHAVGVQLLDRSKRGVEPTRYGEALIRRGVAIFDEMQQSLKDIEFLSDPTAGEVRIGATEPITAAIVLPVVDKLSRLYPQMKFNVIAADTMPLMDALSKRVVDLTMTRLAQAVPEELNAETLFYDTLVVATGIRNPLTRRRGLTLADVKDEPWLLPIDRFFGGLIAGAFRASGLEPPQPTVASSSSTLRDGLLTTHRFLTVVAGFSLLLHRKRSDLKALPILLPNTRHPVAVVTLKSRLVSPAAQMFIDHVRKLTAPLKIKG
jgi:DNA-binding transcriptional LysR family regulator